MVLGTLLNDHGDYYSSCKGSLCREMFQNKRNAFVFGLIEDMHNDGISDTFPIDVFNYANEKDVKYGNMNNFCVFLCEVAMDNAYEDFKKYVRELVRFYLKDIKHGTR